MIKIGDIEIKQGQFPDGTLLMKIPEIASEYCAEVHNINITWLYENDAELFSLICVKRYIDENFYDVNVDLRMPYIPHARQDRVKRAEDVFTLKYFCEVINSLHFNTVIVRDAHSNVSLALLNNVIDEQADYYARQAIEVSGAEILFFPDEGAMKRYSDNYPMPYAFGMKKRDWETGNILGLDIINAEAIVGKDVLIVDDICSRGGTFYYAAKVLKAAGAKSVSLYITHCEKTIAHGDLPTSQLIDHVYTTHSILPEDMATGWITILE